MINNKTLKQCYNCKIYKNINDYHKDRTTKDGLKNWCKECMREYQIEYNKREEVIIRRRYVNNKNRYKNGIRTPGIKNKDCPYFLGVAVAENILSKVFKNVKRMLDTNPGFDFTCDKGYKIDVKASCFYTKKNNPCWMFHINKNKIPDYFILIGFDNRKDLNPMKLWLVPKDILKDKVGLSITNTERSLKKWKQYELGNKLDEVITCCSSLQSKKV